MFSRIKRHLKVLGFREFENNPKNLDPLSSSNLQSDAVLEKITPPLSSADTDKMFLRALWTHSLLESQNAWDDAWLELCLSAVRHLITEHHFKSITELDCGDFRLGDKLWPLVDHYLALDSSEAMIHANREKYPDAKKLQFATAHAIHPSLSASDLILARDVLGKLTNADIETVLQKIEKSGARFLLVIERVPLPEKIVRPNVDLPPLGLGDRLWARSGVFINEAPFSRVARLLEYLPASSPTEKIALFLYPLKSN